MQNQIDHIFIDNRRFWSVVNVPPFIGADCDTDHYLVIEEVRGRLSVSKRLAQTFNMERFKLYKLNDAEIKEECLELWKTWRVAPYRLSKTVCWL